MGHQSHVLLCTETTVSNPPVVFPKSSCDVHLLRRPWTTPSNIYSIYVHTCLLLVNMYITLHTNITQFHRSLKRCLAFFYLLNLQHFSIQGTLSRCIPGIKLTYSFETRVFLPCPCQIFEPRRIFNSIISFSNKGETSVKVTFLLCQR